MDENEITKLIDAYMAKHKICKTKFCRVCGISTVTLNKICRGDHSIKMGAALRICRVLEISLDDFCNVL